MSLLSLIVTLLIEQFRPLDYARWIATPLRALADLCERNVNAGTYGQGVLGWSLIAGIGTLAAAIVFFLLDRANPLLALAWNVVVLYVTMGFRQVSHFFTDIHVALRMGELERARAILGEWRGRSASGLASSDIARLAIEEALVASHRNVFAVIFWFVVLPGPCGAVLYRVSEQLARTWRADAHGEAFAAFAQQAFAWIDWLPQRITAVCFAIVGDFEDAVYCWRTQAERWANHGAGIILSSGAGALGVRLGMPVVESGELTERPDIGLGEEADVDFMQSTIGLVWRALVVWLLILLLVSVASWIG